jgi:hypothetical protein
MGRGVLPTANRLLRMVPLGPRTCRLCLTGGRVLIAKWGSAWEGAVLRVIEDLGIAPRLLAPPGRPQAARGGGRPSGGQPRLLLMTEAAGSPPDWTDPAALAGVMGALGELHRRTARADGSVLCHGDLHRANLLWDGERATLLDWGSARRGAPLDDLARITLQPTVDTPGCDLPTGEAAEAALATYHQVGPLAHLSWPAFQAQHRAVAQQHLHAQFSRHQTAASAAPAGVRAWIETQLEQVQRQLDHLNL